MKPNLAVVLMMLVWGCAGPIGPQGEPGDEGPPGDAGAAGPKGDTGSTGGGYYTSRENVYCNEVIGTTSADAFRIAVDCNDANDLYLTGGCDRVNAPDSFLYENAPVAIDQTTASGFSAGHRCQWVFNPGGSAPSSLPSARGRVCCIQVP